MRPYFTDLIKYNDWANHRVLATLTEAGDQKEATKLFSHLISAQIIWLNRIKDLPTSPFPLWEEYKLTELSTMTRESTTNWLNYIKEHRMNTFEEMIFYTTTKGDKKESTIREIITHVINHSTYHRGQIANILRQNNIEPPVTDYIAYCRFK